MHHAFKTWCIVSTNSRYAIKTTYFFGNRWFFYAKKLGVPSDAIEFDPILTPIAFLKSSGNAEKMGNSQLDFFGYRIFCDWHYESVNNGMIESHNKKVLNILSFSLPG